MNAPYHASERGMTLIEMLVALTLTLLVFSAALGFLRQQGQAFDLGMDQMMVLQNHRYTVDVLEKDLRTVGSGVPDRQPFLVYAGSNVIAFNADYTTNTPDQDRVAIYVDTAAPAEAVSALTRERAYDLPETSFTYPGVTYYEAEDVPSPAETIIFFFRPDSSTTRIDDFVLLRKVNDLPEEAVARNLLRTRDGDRLLPFFQYFEVPDAQSADIRSVPAAVLPLMHSIPAHGSAADTADTGEAARVDLIRGARVNFTATNGHTGVKEQTQEVSRLIQFPNAGLRSLNTCGAAPLLGTELKARHEYNEDNGRHSVKLSWDPALDEGEGERDIVRYVIWRSETNGEWGNPYTSIPSGESSYFWPDRNVVENARYWYALAAQDCTPTLSAFVIAGPVRIREDDDDD